MSQIKETLDEVLDSLSGYDEIGIEQQFGGGVLQMLKTQPTTALRALIFVDVKRRDDLNVQQAKAYAMELPLRAVNDYFAEEPEDTDPEQPDSEAGKEDEQPT